MDLAKRAVLAVGLDPKLVAPRRMLSRISAAKSLLLSPNEFAQAAETYDDEVVARIYADYQRTLRKANAVDFDDLLGLPIRLFDEAPGTLDRYQERFQHILVDEYQDTNRVQYVLVSALAARWRNLFVVGDPDQSIYGWRQADIRNILDFEKDYADATRIHLETNYRSTRRIVETADRVIRENTQRIDRRLRTENDEGRRSSSGSWPTAATRRASSSTKSDGLTQHGGRLATMSPVMYRTGAQSRVPGGSVPRFGHPLPDRRSASASTSGRRSRTSWPCSGCSTTPRTRSAWSGSSATCRLGRGIGPKALDAVASWAAATGETVLDGLRRPRPGRNASATAPDSRARRAARDEARDRLLEVAGGERRESAARAVRPRRRPDRLRRRVRPQRRGGDAALGERA
jgi:DNA helicase-2/ATP-dependent DNA helicase PcrA